MKTFTLNKALMLISLSALFFSSCYKTDYYPCIKPRGASVEEIRITSTFSGVDLRMHANVIVQTGTKTEVRIEAPENFLDFIDTRISGNYLIIESSRCLTSSLNDITVYITTPSISRFKISGSGNINVLDVVNTSLLELEISGSGNIFINTIAQKVESKISGSGNIDVLGTTSDHVCHISGSGDIKSFGLISPYADVRISGSGTCSVFAEENLKVNISGSGNVRYKGNPLINVNITGSGRVINSN